MKSGNKSSHIISSLLDGYKSAVMEVSYISHGGTPSYHPIYRWIFHEINGHATGTDLLEVPIPICWAYFSGLNFREYPHNSYGQTYGTKLVPPCIGSWRSPIDEINHPKSWGYPHDDLATPCDHSVTVSTATSSTLSLPQL